MGLRVLAALDAARLQWYHFKAIIVAGMGLFTDAYDLFCFPPIMVLIGRIYYDHGHESRSQLPYQIPPLVSSVMVGVPLLGTVIGQSIFGWLGDRMGRRKVYGFSLMLMVLSSLGCGFSACKTRTCVLTSLGFFRFLLGVGIGGDYPLSATIMSEFANKRTRGSFIAAVFSMQGFGILFSSAVTMVVCAIFDHASKNATEDHTPEVADLAWRIILAIGAVPAALTLYWRLRMPETARYTALVRRDEQQATEDMVRVGIQLDRIIEEEEVEVEEQERPRNIPAPAVQPYPLISTQFFYEHGRHLIVCALTWFLVDIVFYSSNLFQSQIYRHFLPGRKNMNAYTEAYKVARLQAIIAACSTIPGYWATVFFIDRVGRVKIQVMGFFFMALGLFSIGIPYYMYWDNNTDDVFMFLYGLTFFFSNFGPNTTTFIVPAELFPARFRTSCHGLSGAFGKVGAIIGSVGFLWASHNKREDGFPNAIGMTASLIILGGVCLVGTVLSLFMTETMGRSLEENETKNDNRTEMHPIPI
ncbi:Major facilitator, sugar transporter-like [Dillenia turbinata]|uniref:Major facilitator, sugar transporter-like n=1 Tax=Dillenia turbinata TaxID=194707 RepID=A0AAN8ZM19_9MAGN